MKEFEKVIVQLGEIQLNLMMAEQLQVEEGNAKKIREEKKNKEYLLRMISNEPLDLEKILEEYQALNVRKKNMNILTGAEVMSEQENREYLHEIKKLVGWLVLAHTKYVGKKEFWEKKAYNDVCNAIRELFIGWRYAYKG